MGPIWDSWNAPRIEVCQIGKVASSLAWAIAYLNSVHVSYVGVYILSRVHRFRRTISITLTVQERPLPHPPLSPFWPPWRSCPALHGAAGALHSQAPILTRPFRRPPSATARQLSNHRPSGVCCVSELESIQCISSQPLVSSR